jgi:hypothetical protein
VGGKVSDESGLQEMKFMALNEDGQADESERLYDAISASWLHQTPEGAAALRSLAFNVFEHRRAARRMREEIAKWESQPK